MGGLSALLDEDGAVVVHPFALGELVLGGLSTQEEELLGRLPSSVLVPHAEVIAFVRARRLMRRRIGWIDAHLLASALASSAVVFTLDRDLRAAAGNLRAAYPA